MAATAALGCWAALVVSGLFEYNFGDSEVLALFLFFMAAPYAFQGRAIAGTPGQTWPERQTLSQP
jgi:hypothetical protein